MARRKKGQPISGWVNLDKPVGIGSTKALSQVRRFFDAQKAGHAGTLDPLASGILPIALGEATKVIPYIQDADKIYFFTVKWGEATETDDCEGAIIETSANRPSPAQIDAVLSRFTGDITQIPPKYSAIKIDGKRAYDLARAGAEIEMKARQVRIDKLELLETRPDTADFRVYCGKGTYVRSLARDIAAAVGTCGHVTVLRRVAVGDFTLANAISLEMIEKIDHSAALEEILQPLQAPLDDIPAMAVNETEAAKLRNGQTLSFISDADFHRLPRQEDGKTTALLMLGDKAVALAEINDKALKPFRIFNT